MNIPHDYVPFMDRFESYARGRENGYRRGVCDTLKVVAAAAALVAFFAFYFATGGAP